MKHPDFKLFRTTAIRLAIKSVFLYGSLLIIVLLALSWASNRHISPGIVSELETEISELRKIYQTTGQQALIDKISALQKQNKHHIYFLYSNDNEKLAGNLLEWPGEADIAFDEEPQGVWIEEDIIPFNIRDDDAYWPVIATQLDNNRLLLARNIRQEKTLLEFSEFMIEAMGVAILFAVFISIMLGRTILRRMNTIHLTAKEIMQGDLNRRIEISNNNDEFDDLSKQLNSMLDRIQQLIKGIRDVTDNIAHDLRSPLTRMRNNLEVTLLEQRSPQEYEKVLADNITDIEHLIKTFNALLSIAQTEAGSHRTSWSKINLKELATDLLDLYSPLAESRQQSLELINGENSTITGSRDLLAQSFGNLIENAIKYTAAGGHIKLIIKTTKDWLEFTVEDNGSGIAENETKRVLEKFVRLESSRHTPGNGLGLSLVSAVAALHKAELKLEDAHPGLRVIQRFRLDQAPPDVEENSAIHN